MDRENVRSLSYMYMLCKISQKLTNDNEKYDIVDRLEQVAKDICKIYIELVEQ